MVDGFLVFLTKSMIKVLFLFLFFVGLACMSIIISQYSVFGF